jgi:hypothetical protein
LDERVSTCSFLGFIFCGRVRLVASNQLRRVNGSAGDSKPGVITLDKHNRVISAPGGQRPCYAGNLHACQWYADQVYPYKLNRV